MKRVRILGPKPGRGPRIVVGFGGATTSFTVSEATDLHREIGEALLIVAKRYNDIDPRIVEPDDQ